MRWRHGCVIGSGATSGQAPKPCTARRRRGPSHNMFVARCGVIGQCPKARIPIFTLTVVSIIAFRFRSRAALELKLIVLQHQLAVLHRQRPRRSQFSPLDRVLWVLLYRIWPPVIDAMVLVKPATVIEWHRKGFRFCWRWRSRRPGRPQDQPRNA
jgi:hypothetical protein